MVAKYRWLFKVLLVLVTIVASFCAYFGFQWYEQEEFQEDRDFASLIHDKIHAWKRVNGEYPLSLVDCDPEYFPIKKRDRLLAKYWYCVAKDRQSFAFGYIRNDHRYQWNFYEDRWDEFALATSNLQSCADLPANYWSNALIDPFK